MLEWREQLYSQDLVQASYEYLYLTRSPLPNFVLPQLPADFKEQSWQRISVRW
ncbi:hypothetical protein LWM68_19405 [Niabella sp. W65]|nr:hypothetical protein [Niabella sp. W65]MCH7364734.1 hypothetical protein [Niabella sp. W65]ULT40580.1 hypothetical protein KRR40_38310 [Niabella sp. I65]